MRTTRWTVPAVAALLLSLGGCATAVDGTPVAAPGQVTTDEETTTSDEETTTTTEEDDSDDGGGGGSTTLDNPTIGTPRNGEAADYCTLLAPEDFIEVLGLTPDGPPSSELLCTINFVEQGLIFVSTAGASEGEPLMVGGNSAILYQSGPDSCQITVALSDDRFNVLDIDVRNVNSPPKPLCEGVIELANRALPKIPAA